MAASYGAGRCAKGHRSIPRREGRIELPALQAALSASRDSTLYLYLFDLLHLDGWDLRECTLLDRKRVLFDLNGWGYSDHQHGSAAELRDKACGMGPEGIICKQADAPYRAGRGHGWVKVKCRNREELIVLGWTPPSGSRVGLGSLHVGYYDPRATGGVSWSPGRQGSGGSGA